MAVEPVPPERYQVFIERGRVAFKPTATLIASVELTVMADTICQLVEDEITPADAEVVVSGHSAEPRHRDPVRDRRFPAQETSHEPPTE
jgi:hypothetical protein